MRGFAAIQRSMKQIVSAAFLAALVAAPALSSAHPSLASVRAALGTVHSFNQVAISPDGKSLAWDESITIHRGGKDVTTQAISLADVRQPGVGRRIESCPGRVCDDASFVWSPDSKKLAFLTTDAASGQAQLALTDLHGHVRRLTTAARGPLADPKWAPDGRSIAVLYTKDGPKSPGPLNPLARDSGLLGATYFEQRLAIANLADSKLKLVSAPDMYVYEYDWSPDGTTFAVSAAHGSGDDNWWVADLYTIAARTGMTKKIHHPELQMASPRWSGDGKRIAYIGGIMSDETITGGDIYVVPAGGGAATDVTPDLHASITTIAWNGSSSKLLVTELAGGSMGVATVDVDAKSHTKRWSGDEKIMATSPDGSIPGDVGVSVSRDGAISAVIRQSFTRAPELYLGPIGAWHAITARNLATSRVVNKAQNLTWKSDAFDVQGWLVYPDGYTPGRSYPMVVIVHGGPSYANYAEYPSGASDYAAFLSSQGYFVLEPNPRGSYGQGEAFTKANIKDFGGGDLRDILAGIDAAEKTVSIDDKRVGVFGWSYGGYMTMWALTQSTRFRAAVSGAGLSDWLSYYGTNNISTWMIPFFGASVYDDPAVYAKSSPINFIKNVKTPTLMVAGDRDAEVPITQSYEYWNALKDLHVPTAFVVYPGEGHEFHQLANQADVARRIVGWFDRWMR